MSAPQYVSAADALAGVRDDVLSGRKPVLYPVGAGGFGRVEIGPGLVTLVGGPPGFGKTALAMQWTADALRLTPDLRATVCNVEMPPAALLERQLARLSGIDLSDIRHRRLTADHTARLDVGLQALAAFADRLAFVQPPFSLPNVAAVADEFAANLIVLDYVQRIDPGERRGPGDDRRASIDALMSAARLFASAGVAVLAVAAVGRGRDAKGRSAYDGLNLASFRESSELEYGADDAYLLLPDPEGDAAAGDMLLHHAKSRYGEAVDLALTFDRRRQHFTAADPAAGHADAERLRSKLADLWGRTAAGGDE